MVFASLVFHGVASSTVKGKPATRAVSGHDDRVGGPALNHDRQTQRSSRHGPRVNSPWHRPEIQARIQVITQAFTARAAFLPRSHSSASNRLVENTIKIVASAAIVGLMFSRMPVNIWRGNVV